MAGQFQRVRVPSLSLLPFLLHPARPGPPSPSLPLARSRPLSLLPFPRSSLSLSLSLSLSHCFLFLSRPFLTSRLNHPADRPSYAAARLRAVPNTSRASPKADRARGFSTRTRDPTSSFIHRSLQAPE